MHSEFYSEYAYPGQKNLKFEGKSFIMNTSVQTHENVLELFAKPNTFTEYLY